MRYPIAVVLGCSFCTLLSFPGFAETNSSAAEAVPAAIAPAGKEDASPVLPSWLLLGGEVMGRAQVDVDGDQARDDRLYLNRLRLRATVRPFRRARFVLEGQDTRAFRLNFGPAADEARNTLDLRQGYFEFGESEAGFQVRFGRQELSVGDERLIGADSDWDPTGQTFDAFRISFARDRFRVEAFTGFRVEPAIRRPDRMDKASRVSGLTARWETQTGLILEPYFLWRRGSDTTSLANQPGHRDVATPGVRALGNLPRHLDYNLEVALQRGHVVNDQIAAWAGHWELGWRPFSPDSGPRLGIEYNFASGDTDPEDGRHQTFDDLYPAGFNKHGITDPFAWRNVRYPAVGLDVPVTRRWSLSSSWRSYWLATVRDGLYPGGDEFLARNSAAGSHIGSQMFFAAEYARSEQWRVSGGFGHLFPGSYLRQSDCSSALKTVYLLTSFVF